MVSQRKSEGQHTDGDSQESILAARQILRNEVPEGYEWIDALTPAHSRMFATELLIAMAQFDISGNATALVDLLESWEATADLDVAPEVVQALATAREKMNYVDWPTQ